MLCNIICAQGRARCFHHHPQFIGEIRAAFIAHGSGNRVNAIAHQLDLALGTDQGDHDFRYNRFAVLSGFNRCLNLPGRSDTIGEMITAMTNVFGPAAEARITWEADATIEKIVRGWRNQGVSEKALRLGFIRDRSFEDTVRWFLEDDIAQTRD